MSQDAAKHRKLATRSRWSALALTVVSVSLLILGRGCSPGGGGPTLFPQTKLDGSCFQKFAVSLPVFGPAGPIPRVDAAAHPNLTVTMLEINQPVLPQGYSAQCGTTLGPTRVWAYETRDSDTGALLGPAHWPAVTIVAQHGVATQAEYVNNLPSFNPSSPSGPGLVQGVLPFDQTVHWADPLKSGCGMPMQNAGVSASCSQKYIGPVPATVHLHGAELAAAYDGDPESWFTPNGLKGSDYHTIGNPGPGKAIYDYPNSQEPGTLWFHDHSLGTTRLNVYAGLAGFYILKNAPRAPKGYPSGA